MLADPAVRPLVEETYSALNRAVDTAIKTETPPELTAALQNNAFIFSGFKTFHSLSEVGLALTDADGHVKPFDVFRRDVEAIDSKYNTNYLYAEYNHAVHTSQMAVKWHGFVADGDRYNLQYRTAGDERVRSEHAALDNITLPPSDPFWNDYLPPNGWNCRCDVDQVLRDDYPMSDPELARAAGDACTDEPKARMFRYNAGREMTLFPAKHPYLPKGCGNCPQRGSLNLATRPDRALPQCRVCGEVFRECRREGERRLNEWKSANIPERGGLSITGENFHTGSLLVTRGSVRGVVGHTLNMAVRDSLLGIRRGAASYRYIGWKECGTDPETGRRKHPEAAFFLYYEVEIAGRTYFANVKAHRHYKAEELYCIRERCNVADLRHDAPPAVDDW
ncbi:MAG: hypothetical protein J6C77_01790 [Muribaculaceae bacterium]|nr:hypothetical protein [Muribaculaceae bacterium]